MRLIVYAVLIWSFVSSVLVLSAPIAEYKPVRNSEEWVTLSNITLKKKPFSWEKNSSNPSSNYQAQFKITNKTDCKLGLIEVCFVMPTQGPDSCISEKFADFSKPLKATSSMNAAIDTTGRLGHYDSIYEGKVDVVNGSKITGFTHKTFPVNELIKQIKVIELTAYGPCSKLAKNEKYRTIQMYK